MFNPQEFNRVQKEISRSRMRPENPQWSPELSTIQSDTTKSDEFEQLLVNASFVLISDIGFNIKKYSRSRSVLTVKHCFDHESYEFTLFDLQNSEYPVQLFVYANSRMEKIL